MEIIYDLAALHEKVKVIGPKGGSVEEFLDAVRKELDELRDFLGT